VKSVRHRKLQLHPSALKGPGKAIASALALALALMLGDVSDASALDLMQSYQLALQQDAQYLASRAEAEASREALPQARAQLLPSLSSTLSQSSNDTNSTIPGVIGIPVNKSYQYQSSSYAVTLRQPIYRKYNFAAYKQAESQVDSIDASSDKSLQDLAVRLSGAYFDALMAQHQLALVLSAKDAYAAQLEGAKRSFAKGLGTRTDIDDAQARYDMVLAQELEASQNVGYTRRQLQVMINQPAENLALLSPGRMELVPPLPANAEDWIKRGEEVNNELRAMRANIESARQEIEKARAGHMPTVDLTIQRSRNLSANDQTINQFYLSTQIGVQVNIPMFAGGFVNSQVRQAKSNLEKYEQLYEAKRRDIGLQIRKEFQNVAEGVLKVKALEQAERSADQAIFSSQKGFQAGTRTQIDILNSQQQRMNTGRDLAQARYLYVMARIRLQGLVGSLNENEISDINSWLTLSTAPVSND
jgi:TolC family type I secretion outer membrane protein